MVEIIIYDGWINDNQKEERIIRLISDDNFDEDKIDESVTDLMRFFYSNTSGAFVDKLTIALKERKFPQVL